MKSEILNYQQKCYRQYSKAIGLPDDYSYFDGNPIRPLVPIETCQNSVMIIGAYPSARFESRESRLVPVGDNLGPFQPELYFDGVRVRRQESADGLKNYILKPLDLPREKCWITDLVKVFLFKPDHIKNYMALGINKPFADTRKYFDDYAAKSLVFLQEELKLAQPKLVITLGEEVARVIANDSSTPTDKLLSGIPRELQVGDSFWRLAHVAHPDACRRFAEWGSKTEKQMKFLSPEVIKIIGQETS